LEYFINNIFLIQALNSSYAILGVYFLATLLQIALLIYLKTRRAQRFFSRAAAGEFQVFLCDSESSARD
jgi:hypothetical protein